MATGQMFIPRRSPWNHPNAIEAKQAEVGAQPEITIGRLSNCVDGALIEAVANFPRGVRVLTDIERRIEGVSAASGAVAPVMNLRTGFVPISQRQGGLQPAADQERRSITQQLRSTGPR
jgi:hypothetical protein